MELYLEDLLREKKLNYQLQVQLVPKRFHKVRRIPFSFWNYSLLYRSVLTFLLVEETLEVSQMFAKVYEYYHKVFGKDMVDVMMASKRIEVQLISRPQKEAILESCKELAAKYKQVKNILARGMSI